MKTPNNQLVDEGQIHSLRTILIKCWKKDTSFSHSDGSKGQCYVTALLIKYLYGGEILHGYVNQEHHFWNLINGKEIDLTSDQYGGNGFNPVTCGRVYKRVNFENRRFRKLLERYNAIHM